MPTRFAAIAFLTVAASAAAHAQSCERVPPLITVADFRAVNSAPCGPEATAVATRIEAARVCYYTGLAEGADFAERTKPVVRTVRVRRGTQVEEVEVTSKVPVSRIVDIGRSLDTVALRIDGTMCLRATGAEMVAGRWAMRGEDAGTTFDASGFLPSAQITTTALPSRRGFDIGFDFPEVRLANDPQPRQIRGSVFVPLD